MVDCELFGLEPAGPHLINVGLHIGAILFLYLALLSLTGKPWRTFLVAAFIGLSPLRMESVAWIAERKDVLSLFFGFLTLYLYAQYAQKNRRLFYPAALLTLTLGLLTKPSLVVVPPLLLLLDFWPLNRLDRKTRFNSRVVLEKIPFFILALGGALSTIYAQNAEGAVRSLDTLSIGDRIGVALTGYLGYLGKFIWPYNLGVYYPLQPLPSGIAAGGLILFLLLSFLAVKEIQRRPYLFVGWTWFVVSALPIIGLVQIGAQQYADRWTYLPHIGLSIALVWYVADTLTSQRAKRVAFFSTLTVVTLFGIETFKSLHYWRSSEPLFRQTLAVAPHNFFIHNNLGVVLNREGRVNEAIYHYEQSIRYHPTYPLSLNNLGAALAKQGRIDRAIVFFKRSIAASPDFADGRYHLGLAYEHKGEHLRAISEWLTLLSFNPDHKRTRESLHFVSENRLNLDCTGMMETSEQTTLLSKTLQSLKRWKALEEDRRIKARLEQYLDSCRASSAIPDK
jgi:hypothetical protein